MAFSLASDSDGLEPPSRSVILASANGPLRARPRGKRKRPGGTPMATTATYGTLSASEHSTNLRKAVIASTIGTTIEWYDFFIYGTAAGLIFGKLYFPNEDPLTATLAAFGTYFMLQLDILVVDDFAQLLVKLRHDRRRRVGGGDDTGPRIHVEAGHSGFVQRRQFWQQRAALQARYRKRA